MANSSVQLAETILTLGVRASQGETVQTPTGTVTPVALVAFGTGGGSDNAENGGGGGSGLSIPLGAYVSGGQGTRFVPNTVVLTVVGLAGIARVVRAARR
ncbi:hypothetical protein E5F05_09595 [Deinococcus metallilatus]|uniref:Spore protein YtfJ n=1 Tax=Deinococcus metallilatus TaxID=1211322 RepID=A0AAJ5JXY7_9DEIO|nr:hypothetical protein [Deinococcus metallilatus]MBB5296008.1 putative spore protein YtfJ [Deinococcus metallilatus]QBY08172.1 hypothetical protein E5F05_09595 [Deinococcus metallilatus]RXJ11904.1 hypothetical protein ERJ73_08405 [Deinococcus metallilatus]TLK25864.1 hypothetical protein FCS05_12575 [Deinococcus metallilatus]GMA14457.1 hypothetical protein GCM10025871_07880 [Deinococcus metallilatus]